MIKYTRGRIQILDVEGLKESACECFETVREQYAQLLGHHPARKNLKRPSFSSPRDASILGVVWGTKRGFIASFVAWDAYSNFEVLA